MYALIMGILGAILLPLGFKMGFSKRAFEKRKAKFAEGKGKDPEKDFIGPHKPAFHNAIIGGGIFYAIGFGASLGAGL